MRKNGINLRTLQEKLADKHYREIWEKVRNQLFDETTDMIIAIEQQLAEKDKEIDKLLKEHFEMFGDMKDYKNLWLAEQRKNKEVRHQVCEEIRLNSKQNIHSGVYTISYADLYRIEKKEGTENATKKRQKPKGDKF